MNRFTPQPTQETAIPTVRARYSQQSCAIREQGSRADLGTESTLTTSAPKPANVTRQHLQMHMSRRVLSLHSWLMRHSIILLRLALGAVFLGFGALKFFPGVSPAEALAVRTFMHLTLGLVPATVARISVATLECTIGVCFLSGRWLRVGVALLGVQMIGAMSPLMLFTGELFNGSHHAPSLEGQYVLKDVVLVTAGLVIAATLKRRQSVYGGEQHTANPREDDSGKDWHSEYFPHALHGMNQT